MQKIITEITQSETLMADISDPQLIDIFQHLHTENHRPAGEQFLAFTLGDEIYAVDILCVQEIRTWETVTRIPNTADYIKGVINLRGSIIPVFDLRVYFQLQNIQYLPTTVAIVIAINTAEKDRQISMIVDTVSDVICFTADEINSPPQYGDNVRTDFITGLVSAEIASGEQYLSGTTDSTENKHLMDKIQDSMVMLLNPAIIAELIDDTGVIKN